jgi:hypothetical protein
LSSSSATFDFKTDKIITSAQKLAAQGLPADYIMQSLASQGLNGIRDSHLEGFAGQGMSLPGLGAVVLAFFLHQYSPWWNHEDEAAMPKMKQARVSSRHGQ